MTAAPTRDSSSLGVEERTDESSLETVRRGLALTPNALRGGWLSSLT